MHYNCNFANLAIVFCLKLLDYCTIIAFLSIFVSVIYVSYCILFEINKIIKYSIIRRDK